MRHHLDRNVDSSFEAFQKRLRTRELGTPDLDNQNRRLFSLPSQFVVRHAFIADPDYGQPEIDRPEDWRFTGEAIHRPRVIHSELRKR